MLDFRRITLFCLEKCLSKHKITIFSKNFGGSHGPFPPGYAYGFEMKFTSPLGGMQEAGAPETAVKRVTPCLIFG